MINLNDYKSRLQVLKLNILQNDYNIQSQLIDEREYKKNKKSYERQLRKMEKEYEKRYANV